MKAILYFHGKGGKADEANYYKKFFPEDKVIGVDYKKNTPQETKIEFQNFYEEIAKKFEKIIVIANSIGAYFVMNALAEKNIERAFFISSIVDMEKVIQDMMKICGVSEKILAEKKIISTNFGENLSWEYFCYVRNNPIEWKIPTEILFGEKDNLTSLETIKNFAEKNKFSLTVMKNGEHFFHTDEQMDFLDNWLKKFFGGIFMKAEVEGEKLVIFFDSRIDTNNATEVESEIKNFVEKNPNLILEFDAENLEYISSVGLRILLKFRKIFKKILVIKNVSKEVAEVFEMSGFTKFFDVQKKLRQISVENLQEIGRGSTGSVYKLDDENILKVYNENWTEEKVKIERENSQQAFLSGLDTAIAYDVVKVGKNFGIVYEMLNAATLEKIILEKPEQTEFYAKKFAEFVKKQSEIEFEGISSKKARIELTKKISQLDAETHEIIEKILEKVPESKNFSHGDLNLSNIVVQDENFLMIDMGEISCGHKIFDVAWIYYMYDVRQRVAKKPIGPKFMPEIFWKTFSQEYFNTKDEKILQHFEAELHPHGIIQVLISSLTRDLPPQIFGHYSKVLKEINSIGLPEIDFFV